jgi:hypothetical protein
MAVRSVRNSDCVRRRRFNITNNVRVSKKATFE